MICDICKRSLEGVNDPTITPRLRVVPEREDSSGRALFDFEKHVFGHHRTLHSLQQSQEQQCLLCKKVLYGRKPAPVDHEYFTTFQLSVDGAQLVMHLECRDEEFVQQLALAPLEAEHKPEEWNLGVDDSTGGQHAQKLIDKWDKNCRAKHSQCRQASGSAFLPTRLLDFENVSNPATCRLVSREEVPPGSRYTTLSYCWGTAGKQGRTCLLQSTFNTIRIGLPLTSLPKTYVDAIHVTARLGVRYIWIDALCIIQDSPSDWRCEASTMQAVYRNSYLTISAVAGPHDDSGLFYLRDPIKVRSTVINIAYTSSDKPKPFLYEDEYLEAEKSWQVDNVTTKRGWCLQERLLPSRVLHFGAQQVFWECREQRASERIPGHMWQWAEEGLRLREQTRVWKPLIGATQYLDARDTYKDLFREWYNTLVIYSRCQLTHASDKLVAISGLANDMKIALDTHRPGIHHTYLAGLWAEDLRFGLCWCSRTMSTKPLSRFRPTFSPSSTRPFIYRSPSWSPMSLDGFTKWDPPLLNDELIWYVAEMDCTGVTHCIDGLDTGEVTGGQLELTGPWATIQIEPKREGRGQENARFWAHIEYLDPSTALMIPLVLKTDGIVFYDTNDDIVEQASCIPVYARPFLKKRWCFIGIVLVPVKNRLLTYRRVGLVQGDFDTKEIAYTFFSQGERKSVTII